jgi:hypothetical protein
VNALELAIKISGPFTAAGVLHLELDIDHIAVTVENVGLGVLHAIRCAED